jgi:hypothetical protein
MFRKTGLLAAAAFLLVIPAPGAFAQNAIATADGETPGTRIEITELSRTSGDTVTLKVRLIADSGVEVTPYELMEQADLRWVHLIDAASKKKYLVIKDSDGYCVCSSGLKQQSIAGKSMNLWARFPAPPAEVKEVSVIFPHFIPTDAAIAD